MFYIYYSNVGLIKVSSVNGIYIYTVKLAGVTLGQCGLSVVDDYD
jgi:hypothetical protein